jgi:type I restriction enzyme S subunit
MIAQLTDYKQSVITEAVTKGLNNKNKLVPSGIDWIEEIPEGWMVCRIKDLVNLQSGTNLTTMEISDNGTYPVYGGNGLRGYYEEYSNDGEYILIGRQGALCGNINYASGKFWATEHAVVCYPKREFAKKWLGELLRTMNLGQYSLSAAQPGLSVERIKNLKMPLPSLFEQQIIASYLDSKCSEIDNLIAVKQQKIETLKEYKKSLIFECVTGKKDIN